MKTPFLPLQTPKKRMASVLGGCALLLCLEARAANFTVTTTLDTGPGSLRQIMTQANAAPGSHQITFGVTGKIILVSGLPPVDVNLTFMGPGVTNLTIASSGTDTGSVFTFNSNSVSTLSGLTIASGNSSSNGGGIYNRGNLTVFQTLVASNSAALNGGGVYNAGTLAISNSTIQGNATRTEFGGGICNLGNLQISDSLLQGNKAYGGNGTLPKNGGGGGGGAGLGGGIFTTNNAVLLNCTITGNQALGGNYAGGPAGAPSGTFGKGGAGARPRVGDNGESGNPGGFGGGGGGGGGGKTGSLTFGYGFGGSGGAAGSYGGSGQNGYSGDSSQLGNPGANPGAGGNGGGGGGLGAGIFLKEGALYMTNCTVALNSAVGGTAVNAGTGQGVGGGIFNFAGAIVMRNTLVAANTASSSSPDLLGNFASQGWNLIGNNQGASGLTVNDFQNVSGGLASLADNGGLTLTHALLPGSLAIDGGRSSGAPGADQRGFARPVGSAVDIGAFEYLASTPVVGPTTAQTNVNGTVTFSVSVAGGGLTYQWQRNGTNVAGATSATFTVAGGTEANAGRYSVLVGSPTGPLVTSQPSVLRFFGDLKTYAGMVITGEAGDSYRIEAADILPGVTNWVTVTTFTHPGGTFLYTDPNSPGRAQRYYRAVLLP